MNRKDGGAIILGGHIQALGIIRSLGSRKIPIFLAQSEIISVGMFSKYVNFTCLSPSENNAASYLKFLIELSTERKLTGWTLYPTNDQQVEIISRNFKLLSSHFKFSTPDWDVTKKLINKKRTYKFASTIGIEQPYTWFPQNAKELITKSKEIDYPVIIKPAIMHLFFNKTKKKAILCKNRFELLRNYKKVLTLIPKNQIMIQDFIPGGSDNLYSFCSLQIEDQSFYPLVAKRIRQHPIDFGSGTTFAKSTSDKKLQNISNHLLSKLKYTGVSEVEFKKDSRDGSMKFLEVNARTWKWHTIGKERGFDYSYQSFLHLNKNSIPNVLTQPKTSLSWIHLSTDLFVFVQLLQRKMIDFKTYINSVKGGKLSFANISFSDPLPFLLEIFLLPYLILKR